MPTETASRSLSTACAIAAALAAWFAQSTAWAQPSTAVEQAEVLFRQGRDAMRRHQYIEACGKFRESDALDPSPGTRLNWAICDERIGHLAQALAHARWALGRLGPDDDRRPIAAQLAADLEKRVPHLTVVLSADSGPAARVYLDGEPLSMKGNEESRAVDPGEHVIFVEEQMHEPRRVVVTLQEGDTALQPIAAGPVWRSHESVVRRPPPHEVPAPSTRHTLGLLLADGAALAVTAATAVGALALSERAVVDHHCSAGVCDVQGFEAADRGRSYVHVGAVALTIAAASGVAAAVLLWPRKPGRAVSIAPLALTWGAGLAIERGF